MSTIQKTCPNCGNPTAAEGVCPHCEADVGDDDRVLSTGDTYTFAVGASGVGLTGEEVALTVLVVDEWAELLGRIVFVAEAVACRRLNADEASDEELLESLDQSRFLLEEHRDEFERGLDKLPTEGALPLRTPVAQKRVNDRDVFLYRNDAGISLAELVTLADGQLELRRLADVYTAVLEGLSHLHEAGVLHLYLSPEMVRIRPANSTTGVPLRQKDPDETDPEDEPGALTEETDVGHSGIESGAGEPSDNPFASDGYEETQPQEPLDSRLEAVGGDQLPGLEETTGSLADTSSEVNHEEMSEETWIHALLGELSGGREQSGEHQHVAAARQGEYADPPSRRDRMDLEVVFDSVCGMFSVDEPPRQLEVMQGFSPPEAYTRGEPSMDAVSDVFSAGMLLYYLISGRIPPVSVYTRHAPAIPARHFRPAFPPGLGPVVKRATRPDPEMRYPDVAAMASGFESAVDAIVDRGAEGRVERPELEGAVDRHTGIAKRQRNPVNQDDVFQGSSEDGKFAMFVIADGVSTASYGSGDVASGMLIDVAEETWNDLLPSYLMEESIDEVEVVEEVFGRANERIVDYVNERHTPFDGGAHEVMGTTGLVALYHEGEVTLGSVGDSRGYLQRGPGLDQLTIDHNLWTLSILEGVPADDALAMPRGDALARCLGAFDIEDGYLEAKPPGIDLFQFPVTSGDTLLLTTDGLVDFAGGNVASAEENILSTLLSEPDPALACLELILLANRGGGGDNIGLGIARFD
jgi:protein phosphatase